MRARFYILIGLVACSSLGAAPGDLDPAFGTGGKVITRFGDDDFAQAAVIQPDGKILVAGSVKIGAAYGFALARYSPDGRLDPEFGFGGKVTTFFPAGFAFGESVALQSDGKILVAGTAFNGANQAFAVARYLQDGSLDPTFDADGKVTAAFLGGPDIGKSVIVQPDNRILVAGQARSGSDADFGLVRINPDGSLDPTFGGGSGKVLTDFGSGDDSAECVILQSDGKILVAGKAKIGAKLDFALARYLPSGILDPSFDTDGRTSTHFGAGDDGAESLSLLPGGRIVLAGWATVGPNNEDFALALYDSSGARDYGFGFEGKVTTDFDGSFDGASGIAVLANGKFLLAGSANTAGSRRFALALYNPDGALDPGFDDDGKLTTGFGGSSASAKAVALQDNGRAVAAGSNTLGGNDEFAVARYQGVLYRPDNQIGPRPTRQRGDDIYNRTGARQKLTVSSRNRRTVKFVFTVQNDSDAIDALLVRAPRRDPDFRVTYLTPVFGNVTASITRGSFAFFSDPAQRQVFQARAKPKKGGNKTLRITSASLFDPTRLDVVVARVKAQP